MNYSVKNVKSFRGREGHGFNSTLYRDNKRVAYVDDDANGGECNYHWLDAKEPRVEVETTNWSGKSVIRKCTPEEAKFLNHIKGMIYTCQFTGDEHPMTEDIFVCELVEAYEEIKQYKRWCRKQTCFRLKGDKEGAWRTVNAPYDARVKAWVEKKYGDKVEEILNERFVA